MVAIVLCHVISTTFGVRLSSMISTLIVFLSLVAMVLFRFFIGERPLFD